MRFLCSDYASACAHGVVESLLLHLEGIMAGVQSNSYTIWPFMHQEKLIGERVGLILTRLQHCAHRLTRMFNAQARGVGDEAQLQYRR
jgi:hypothetical protein